MAQSIRMYFDREENITLVKRLASLDVNTKGISAPKEGKFSEKVFVLTGTLDHYTRDKAIEEIEARGVKVTNSVSKNTDYVVAGAEAGSKLEKAKKLGVKIIDEAEFIELLGIMPE